jgi:hypothetical protein
MSSRSPPIATIVEDPDHHSGDEADAPVPKRRHKQLVRRGDSFRKLGGISASVNDWFMKDAALHAKLAKFALANLQGSPSFAAPTEEGEHANGGGVGGSKEHDLAATKIHETFCVLFEEELEHFLSTKNVTMDQFQEMYKLEAEEEKRTGQHFYRWMEIVEFETFLVLMRATAKSGSGQEGVLALLRKVEEFAEEAKREYRKQSALRPLLIKWCPADFNVIANTLTTISKTIPHGLDKATAKSLINWKVKLTTKVMMNGTYQDPPRDEDAWSRYLAVYTSRMDDITFSRFIAATEEQISLGAQKQEESDALKTRRVVWECFDACDETHSGHVDLHFLVKFLDKTGLLKEKDRKKLILKWAGQLMPKEKKPDEVPILLSLEDFQKVLESTLNPAASGDQAQTSQAQEAFRQLVSSVTSAVKDAS